MSVCYSVTPVWTFKVSKVWKTRCQNAATRTWYGNILMLYDIINTHEWFFCYNWHEFCSSKKNFRNFHDIRFSGEIHNSNIKHELALTSSPFMLICNERYQRTQEREPAHTGCSATQRYQISQYFEIGPRQSWFISRFRQWCYLWCSNDSCGQISFMAFWLFVFFSAYLRI